MGWFAAISTLASIGGSIYGAQKQQKSAERELERRKAAEERRLRREKAQEAAKRRAAQEDRSEAEMLRRAAVAVGPYGSYQLWREA